MSEASKPIRGPDTAEMREWLDDFTEDMFNVSCRRCSAPFQAQGYAVAAPPEFYGILEWVRGAADELDRLKTELRDAWLAELYRDDGPAIWIKDAERKGHSLDSQLQRLEQLRTGAYA